MFIAESPLYEITSKTDTYFAYTEAEKQKFLDQLEAEGGSHHQRSKGLGENEPDMMNLTTMNPQTRRLIKVMPTDMEKTVEMVRLAAGGQPKRPKGLHRGKRTLIFGCGGCFVTGFLPRKPPRAWLLFLIFLILKRRRIAEPARLDRERRLPRAWTAQEICVRKSACQPLFSYCFSAQTGGKALGSGWPLFGRAEQRGGIFSRGEPAAWIF